MGADERGTHVRLKDRFDGAIAPLINTHGGRLVKLMGDGLLVEFPSAVNAVEWALASQGLTNELNTGEPEMSEILYRVGINLGDVIVDGDDIFGDGVNIAARLQEMADPGGICISAKVYGEVSGKLNVEFTDGGMESAKNIAEPIHVCRWYKDSKTTENLIGEETDEFVANLYQASVGGHGFIILRRLWPFMLMATITVWLRATALTRIELPLLSALLGLLITIYGAISLAGVRLTVTSSRGVWLGPVAGAVNGILTGMTGSFVLPGVMFLALQR